MRGRNELVERHYVRIRQQAKSKFEVRRGADDVVEPPKKNADRYNRKSKFSPYRVRSKPREGKHGESVAPVCLAAHARGPAMPTTVDFLQFFLFGRVRKSTNKTARCMSEKYAELG